MKKYVDTAGKKVVEIETLAFLYEQDGYSWIARHCLNLRHKKALRNADIVKVPDEFVAHDVEKYYFYRKKHGRTVIEIANVPLC